MDHLAIATELAKLFDNKFKIGGFSFGLDAILGFLPIGGDLIGLFFSMYLIWIAYEMKLPKQKLLLMWANTIGDFLVGSIPVIGDIADFFYKANLANLKILQEHARKYPKAPIIDAEVVE